MNLKRKIRIWRTLIKGYISYKFGYLGVINSPFKGLRVSFYFGEILHGTPYFYPRKWIKYTKKELYNNFLEELKGEKPRYVDWKLYYDQNKGMSHAIDTKWFGIDVLGLGYKSKFEEWRYEYNPMMSIVVLKRQFCMFIRPNITCDRDDVYWEAWLTYKYDTDKKSSIDQRFLQLIEKYSATWSQYTKNGKITVDYFPDILKKKWSKSYKQIEDDKVRGY
jgi:hypothetical protein